MKNKIFISLLVILLVLSGFYFVNKPRTVDGVKIYKNISNVKIDEGYLESVKTLINNKIGENSLSAMEFADYFVKLNEQLYGEKSIQTAYAYIERANVYSAFQIFNVAKQSNDIAEGISENIDDEYLKEAVKWNRLSYYFATSNYYEALNILNNLNQNIFDDSHKVFFDKSYADIYMSIGEFLKSKNYLSKYYEKEKNLYGDNPMADINYYMCQTFLLSNEYGKNFRDIEKLYNAITEKTKQNFSDNKNLLAAEISVISRFYREMKEFDKVIEVLNENADEIYKSNNPISEMMINEEYFEYYKSIRDDEKCFEYLGKLEEFYDRYADNSLAKLNIYNKKADYYQEIEWKTGDEDAKKNKLNVVNKAINIIAPYKETDPLLYAYRLKDYVTRLGQDEVERKTGYYDEIFDIYNKTVPQNGYLFADLYKNYAGFLRSINNNDEALKYYNKALSLYNRYSGKINRNSAEILVNLSNLYGLKNRKMLEINYLKQAINIYEQIYGKNNVIVYEQKLNLSYLYQKVNRVKANRILDEVANAEKKGIIEGTDKDFLYNLYFRMALKNEGKNNQTALEYANKAKENVSQSWQNEQINEFINNINK